MERGFSTLELLIAMTVLTLAIAAMLLLLPNAGVGGIDAAEAREALLLADARLAHEAALARVDPRLVIASTTVTTVDAVSYMETTSVEQVDMFTKRVTTTVSWNALYSRASGVTVSMLINSYQDPTDTCGVRTGVWNIPLSSSVLFGSLPGLRDSSGTYRLTDIDVLRGRLYATVNESTLPLPSDGPRSAGTIANDARTGSIAWTAPGSSRTSDGAYATAPLSGGEGSKYLLASNFGFTIPPGATIIGIEVDVERKASSNANTVRDSEIRIVRADGTLGAKNAAHATNWPTSEAYATYGASNDLWNETAWSAGAIDSPRFGVAFSARSAAGNAPRVASVDDIRITVTYTKQFYVVSVMGTPSLVAGLGENTVSTGMNAVAVATSTSTGSHAFVAMNSGTTQLEVIDVASSPRVEGVFHASGNAVGDAVFYRNGYVYLGLANNTAGPEFLIIDVHDPAAPVLVGSFEIGAGVNDIRSAQSVVSVATDDSSRELVRLDISDLAHPKRIGSFDAPGSFGSGQGRALDSVGDTVYLGRYYSLTTAPEFIALDASSSVPLPVATYDAGPSASSPYGIYGVRMREGLATLLTSSHAGGNIVLLDVEDLLHPSVLATIPLPDGGGGVALDCEGNRLYAASVPQTGVRKDQGALTFIDPL